MCVSDVPRESVLLAPPEKINNLHGITQKIPAFATNLCNIDLLNCHNSTSLKVNNLCLSERWKKMSLSERIGNRAEGKISFLSRGLSSSGSLRAGEGGRRKREEKEAVIAVSLY